MAPRRSPFTEVLVETLHRLLWGRPAGGGEEGSRRQRREFVVIGLGRFGSSVAHELHAGGFNVLAIDNDKDRVQHLSRELPHVVALDATNAEALRQVGVGDFDTGLVSIGMNFESNLLATAHLLRFGVPMVITKARTRTQKEILERIGAHEVILPEQEAGRRLARRLAHGHVIDYLEVSPTVEIVEVTAPRDMWNLTLVESQLRRKYGLTAIAVRRGEDTIVSPSADFIVLKDDILIVVGQLDAAEKLSG